MSVSSPSSGAPMRRTHVVPTHVHTPDVLLTVAGISISIRQFLLLLVGIALAYRGWLALGWLAIVPGGLTGHIIQAVGALLPCGVSGALAFGRLAGRELDVWCAVVVRYWLRPRLLVWRSVRLQEPDTGGWSAAREAEEDNDG